MRCNQRRCRVACQVDILRIRNSQIIAAGTKGLGAVTKTGMPIAKATVQAGVCPVRLFIFMVNTCYSEVVSVAHLWESE